MLMGYKYNILELTLLKGLEQSGLSIIRLHSRDDSTGV